MIKKSESNAPFLFHKEQVSLTDELAAPRVIAATVAAPGHTATEGVKINKTV